MYRMNVLKSKFQYKVSTDTQTKKMCICYLISSQSFQSNQHQRLEFLHQKRDSIVGQEKVPTISIHGRRKIEALFPRKLLSVVTLPVKCNLHFLLGIFFFCIFSMAIPSMRTHM